MSPSKGDARKLLPIVTSPQVDLCKMTPKGCSILHRQASLESVDVHCLGKMLPLRATTPKQWHKWISYPVNGCFLLLPSLASMTETMKHDKQGAYRDSTPICRFKSWASCIRPRSDGQGPSHMPAGGRMRSTHSQKRAKFPSDSSAASRIAHTSDERKRTAVTLSPAVSCIRDALCGWKRLQQSSKLTSDRERHHLCTCRQATH
jgi:hypothetical protein